MEHIPNVPPAGRLKYFAKLGNKEKITTDPVILSYVEGYKIPLLEITAQNSPPLLVSMKGAEVFVEKEIEEKLKKEAIVRA